jgi:hypothetical protein
MMQKKLSTFLFNCIFHGLWKEVALKLFINNSSFPQNCRLPMSKKCPTCKLVNFTAAEKCARCDALLAVDAAPEKPRMGSGAKIFRRVVVCLVVVICAVLGFYLSLIMSAARLSYAQTVEVGKAIAVLDEKGFSDEVFMLNYLTAFRAEDNWLNASVAKENAYAATNFPLEIMTIYPDFFTYPMDDTERAAILLHEAKHLQGKDEKEAYEFIWKNRHRLGWTKEKYWNSLVWQNVRRQTREYVPSLFNCADKEFGDCTEE